MDREIQDTGCVIPPLLEAIEANKWKVRNHAWEAYRGIDSQVDVVPILLSKLNGQNHGMAVYLLDKKGVRALEYLDLLSRVNKKVNELAKLGVNVDVYGQREK